MDMVQFKSSSPQPWNLASMFGIPRSSPSCDFSDSACPDGHRHPSASASRLLSWRVLGGTGRVAEEGACHQWEPYLLEGPAISGDPTQGPLVVQANLRSLTSFLKRVSVGYVFSGSQHLGPAKGVATGAADHSPQRGLSSRPAGWLPTAPPNL